MPLALSIVGGICVYGEALHSFAPSLPLYRAKAATTQTLLPSFAVSNLGIDSVVLVVFGHPVTLPFSCPASHLAQSGLWSMHA